MGGALCKRVKGKMIVVVARSHFRGRTDRHGGWNLKLEIFVSRGFLVIGLYTDTCSANSFAKQSFLD